MRRRIDVYAASRLLGDESRKKGLAASTRRTRYDFVRMAFLAAMKAHVIRQDPPLVSALGHSSPTITLNIHSHLWPKAARGTPRRGRWRRSPPNVRTLCGLARCDPR
jgi:hypothetical protein